jgi:putative Mg2+ transporter-C (MgtC) family protein
MRMLDSLNSLVSPVEVGFVIDLVLAVSLGFAIGAERESRGKDAGISTHSLVLVGAMLFTFMSMTVDPGAAGAIGMAIGFGYSAIAIISTVAVLLIPRIPHLNKKKVPERFES